AAGFLGGGLFAMGAFIVHFLYDTRYSQAGLMLQILALGTAIYPFSIIGGAFTATGDTHIPAIASVSKAFSLVAFITVGFFTFGEIGAIAGVALHPVVPSILIMTLAHRRQWTQILNELRIIPAFAAGLLLGKACVLLATTLGIQNISQIF